MSGPAHAARAPSAATAAVAAALLAGLATAKALALHAVPVPGAWSFAAFADDAATAAGLAWLARWLPRPARAALVAAVLSWAALGVVLVRALGTPPLPSMLRGVDPAMRDSVALHCTGHNLLAVLAILAAATLAARLARPLALSSGRLAAVAAAAALLASAAPPRQHPAHRNALVAFARGLLPRSVPALAPGAADASTATPSPAQAHPAPVLAHAAAAGRSIVLVVLESAGARHALADDPVPVMPNLRALAAAGADFRAAWAVYPESIDGQVAILCALPPAPDAAPTAYAAHGRRALPHRLRPHGYRSALFHAGRFAFLGMADVLAPTGFDHLADAAAIGGERESSFGIDEEAAVDALLRWVAAAPADQRVLASYLPIAGHHPYESPGGGPFARDSAAACHRNALHYADRALGRLWAGLCRLRPPEHWLLAIVGDHGQAFGEHAGNFGHSFALYEENLHVPLVLVAPGAIPPGTVDPRPCSHLDLAPTLLALLGLAAEPSLLDAHAAGRPVHAFTDQGELLVAVRAGRWKLIHDVAAGRDRLFDLAADPGEARDVHGAHGAWTTSLRESALRFLARAAAATGR